MALHRRRVDRCYRRCFVRSYLTRLSILIVTLALLLTACGQGQAPSGAAATSAPAAQPSAAPAEQPTAAAGSASGEAIPIGIAVAQTSNVALLGQEQVIGA